MKVYLESKEHPWITWDSDLWKAKGKQELLELTSIESNANWRVLEWNGPGKMENGHQIAWYIESITNEEIDEFILINCPMFPLPIVLSDSIDVIDRFARKGWRNVWEWHKPTRVPDRLLYSGPMDTSAKDGGFVITCNGSRVNDNLNEILRTYFAMCLQDDPEHEGELMCMQDVDIFSAYELPFETFNNIHFHGLQPNPVMFKVIKKAKLFISPYNGDGIPINAVDAVMLGTPILVRDTPMNRSVFNWDEKCFFADEKELAQKIKFFSEIPTSDVEYQTIIEDGYNALIKTHTSARSLFELNHILQGA